MRKNWLKYLGLMGLLGLLGFFTPNTGYYGFFGFFGFFGFGSIKHDERFQMNINRAARNAFITSIIISVITIIAGSFSSDIEVFVLGFIAVFVVEILVFTFSFQYYDGAGE